MTKALVEQRRRFLLQFSGLGLSSTLLPGVLWAKVQERQAQRITKAMLRDAEQIAGVQFDDAERELILNRVNENVERYDALRTVALPNHVPSALRFSPILRHGLRENAQASAHQQRSVPTKATRSRGCRLLATHALAAPPANQAGHVE